METHSNITDPWQKIIRVLGQLPDQQSAECSAELVGRRQSRRSTEGRVEGLKIHLVERVTTTRVTLAWFDLSRCAYGNQEWHLTRARRSGVCAVSGRRIRRGENVYRPRPSRPQVLNADAMIYTDVLDKGLSMKVADFLETRVVSR